MSIFHNSNVIELTADDLNDAKSTYAVFDDEFVKHRAFANVLAARAALKLLFSLNIDATNLYSMYSINKVLESLDIADVYAGNFRIDARLVKDSDEIFIPKSHFELNIIPDLYVVFKLDKGMSSVEFLGCINPEEIDKSNENKDYYFVNEDLLYNLKIFKNLVRNNTIKSVKSLSPDDMERAENLIIPLEDGEIYKADYEFLIKNLADSVELRKKAVEFENFEFISHKVVTEETVYGDSVLGLIGSDKLYNRNELTADIDLNELSDKTVDSFVDDFNENDYTVPQMNELTGEISLDDALSQMESDFLGSDDAQIEEDEDVIETDNVIDNLSDFSADDLIDMTEPQTEDVIYNNESENFETQIYNENGENLTLDDVDNSDIEFENQMQNDDEEYVPLDEIDDSAAAEFINQMQNDDEEYISLDDSDSYDTENFESQIQEENEELQPLAEAEYSESNSFNNQPQADDRASQPQSDDWDNQPQADDWDSQPQSNNWDDESSQLVEDGNFGADDFENQNIGNPDIYDDEDVPLKFNDDSDNWNETSNTENGFDADNSDLDEDLPLLDEGMNENDFAPEPSSESSPEPEPEPESMSFDDDADIGDLPALSIVQESSDKYNSKLYKTSNIADLDMKNINLDDFEVDETETETENSNNNNESFENDNIDELMTDLNNMLNEENFSFDSVQDILSDEEISESLMKAEDEEDSDIETEKEAINSENLNKPDENHQLTDEIKTDVNAVVGENTAETPATTSPSMSLDDFLNSSFDDMSTNSENGGNINHNQALNDVYQNNNIVSENSIDDDNPEKLYTDEAFMVDNSSNLYDDTTKGNVTTTSKPKSRAPQLAVVLVILLCACAYVNKDIIMDNFNFSFPKKAEEPAPEFDLNSLREPQQPVAAEGDGAVGDAPATPAEEEIESPIPSIPKPTDMPDEPSTPEPEAKTLSDSSQQVQREAVPNNSSNKITKLSWEVPENLANNDKIRRYLQIAGRTLKLTLQNDLLVATELPFSNKIMLDIKIVPSGNVVSYDFVISSGSKQIDNIVLQSVKDTLKYVRPPLGEIQSPNSNLTLIINF